MGTVFTPSGSLGPGGKKTGSRWPAIVLVTVVAALALTAARGYLKTRKPSVAGDGPPHVKTGASAAPTAPTAPFPISMNGWRDFRWGMSQAEAERTAQALGLSITERKTNERGEPVLALSGFTMSGVALNPRLLFAPNLTTVILFSAEENATISVYEVLKKHLTGFFGVPPASNRETEAPAGLVGFEGMNMRSDTWSYPKTTVKLWFFGSVDKPGNSLYVSFKDATIPEKPEKAP
jgi:hypothetical protein